MNLCKTCGTICPFDDEHEECEHYKQMTNEDWLRSCNTEQLTDIFMRFMFDAEFKARFVNGNFINEFREWLKQPHTFK